MSVNPVPFVAAAIGCGVLIIQGRKLRDDPMEERRKIGRDLHGMGILFSCLIAVVFALLIVDALGIFR